MATNALGRVAGVSRAWWNKRSDFVMTRLAQLPAQVIVIDPGNLFCDEVSCLAANDGVAYHFDYNHLSVAGARLVAEEIMKHVKRQ
jgi:lysophospholipase L1-like esterase